VTSGIWRRATAALLAVTLFACGDSPAQRTTEAIPEVAAAELPAQTRDTIALIRKGGPFPYERDGIVFGNFEKLLPLKERGYYREYTVRTPGAGNRGARRIVAGKGGELYYTDDHYASFKRIRESP
jgi:ribonuclease T1